MNKIFLSSTLIILFFLTQISALCEEGQIDINSASLEELDKLYGIGPVKAQAIIDSRMFASVDDLIKVNGIGKITLENIKSQGLACVSKEAELDDNKNVNSETDIANNVTEVVIKNSSPTNLELQAINLNPQAIKSEENSQLSGKGDYAIYGLIAFGVLLGLLFFIKNIVRKRYKNEFE